MVCVGVAASAGPTALNLPRLDQVSPRLLIGADPPAREISFGGRAPAAAPAAAPRLLPDLSPRYLSIRTRQQRRPVPDSIRRASRRLWRSDVKHWCVVQERAVNFGHNEKEEQELAEWFRALDVDRSGTVEAPEVRALMEAMGVEPKPRQMMNMFASIGKDANAALSKPEFIRLMTQNAGALAGASEFAGGGNEGGASPGGSRGLLDPNTRLMMIAYRRQRLLEDVQDPTKRGNFSSAADFNRAYGGKIGEVVPEFKLPQRVLAPHPMSVLPSLSLSPRAPVRPLEPKPPSTRTRAPSSRMAPLPQRAGGGDGATAPADEAPARTPFAVTAADAATVAIPVWDAPADAGAPASLAELPPPT